MKKILLVEDDKFFVKAYEAKLTQLGYQVKTAQDGESAIKLCAEFIPDLVLLDLILPQKDGFQVLSEIKSNDNLKNIPVVILSGLSQPEDKEKVMNAGAVAYVTKAESSVVSLIDVVKKYIG